MNENMMKYYGKMSYDILGIVASDSPCNMMNGVTKNDKCHCWDYHYSLLKASHDYLHGANVYKPVFNVAVDGSSFELKVKIFINLMQTFTRMVEYQIKTMPSLHLFTSYGQWLFLLVQLVNVFESVF